MLLLPQETEEGLDVPHDPVQVLQVCYGIHPFRMHQILIQQLLSSGSHSSVNIAQKITGTQLPVMHDIHTTHCLRKANSIRQDSSHPALPLFTLLPSGKRILSMRTCTSRFRKSFYPSAIRLMNNQ